VLTPRRAGASAGPPPTVRARRAAAAAAAASAPPVELIRNVGAADFEAHVLRASSVAPVIVDVWAAWCKPCSALTPVLEALVRQGRGVVTLAKVRWARWQFSSRRALS
jgi:putative thioredoxin